MSKLLAVTDIHGRRHIVNLDQFSNWLRMGRGQNRYQVAFTNGQNVTVGYVELMRMHKHRLARHWN